MNFANFLALLARRKWIVLLCMVIPAIIVLMNYWTAKPQYTALTTLEVDTSAISSEEYNDVLQSERIKNAYAGIASSDAVIAEVVRALTLEESPQVEAQIVTNTDLIALSVNHPDPDSAQAITDTIIQMLMAQSQRRVEFSETPVYVARPTKVIQQTATPTDWLRTFLLWSLAGFVIGSTLAFLADSADPKLRSTVEIEHAAQLHTLAELPILKKNEPIVFLSGNSAQSEAYRSLRTIISNYGGNDAIQTLLLTSAKSGEGKSTIAVNLGIAMAQAGRKVLLVDCDMRRPAVNEILGISNSIGVSNVLLKQTKISEAIRHLSSFRIDVMTSGPPVSIAAELINSNRMAKLIEELNAMYDLVIFDAPAILPVTDAVVLSRYMSSVIMVVGKDQVVGKEVETARRHLRAVGVEPIGVIINRVKPRESKYYT